MDKNITIHVFPDVEEEIRFFLLHNYEDTIQGSEGWTYDGMNERENP